MRPQVSKPRHGGTRQGAGRKPAYGEPTKTVRVPQSLLPVVLEYLSAAKAPHGGLSADLRPVAARPAAAYVPSLGRHVRAGRPDSGDDYEEDRIDLGTHLVRNPASTFVIRVDGWSMRDAGIAHGDELVVDRSLAPEDGRIVVAEVDGLLTVKRLKRLARGWLLQASNPDYADIPLGDRNDLRVWGVVTHVLRAV
jgi:DNA polymerase V